MPDRHVERQPAATRRLRVWLTLLGAGCTASVLLGCASRGPEASRPPEPPQSPIPTRVRLREVEDHPRISLVERTGDPSHALALAVAHDLGSVGSAALSALLETRLGPGGFDGLGSRPHGLGFELRVLVTSPQQGAEFVRAASRALATPVEPGEPAVTAASERLRALRTRTWSGETEARLAACSGELGVVPGVKLERSPAELARLLERWRRQIFSATTVAFAALGTPEFLEAASQALARTAPWSAHSDLRDPWPNGDFIGVDDVPNVRRLSLALRVEDGPASVEAARQLGDRSSGLAARLSALPFDWRLVRVVGTTRPRGGCLRMDLEPRERGATPATDDIARAAVLTLDEATSALMGRASSAWTLEQSVLEATDPRDAAGVAAWRTLGGRLRPGRRTSTIGFFGPGVDTAMARELERRFSALRSSLQRSTLEVVSRVEAGQGEAWLLLASPCGTYDEGSGTAGTLALMLRAVAERSTATGNVTLEPWVTPDGVGLLAHGPRLGPDESAEALAQRVGSILGRALVGTALHGTDVAAARARLLQDIGPDPRPSYWQALELASPGRVSWLEPRGSWRAVTDVSADAVESRRRAFLSGPLRLAVLANWNDQQVATARTAVERWLGGLRAANGRCSSLGATAAKTGLIGVDAKERPSGATAYVVVALPGGLGTSRAEAEWMTYLLARPGGWLERGLRSLGSAASAEARLVGGRYAAAVLVELRTSEEQAEAAVTLVRGVLERLGRGTVDARDFETARRAYGRWTSESRLDPRRRLVDLWQAARPSDPDLGSFRRFLQRAFATAQLAVVMVRNKD